MVEDGERTKSERVSPPREAEEMPGGGGMICPYMYVCNW
jgi:hypothetical protein